MKRLLLLFFAISLLAQAGFSFVIYDISVKDTNAEINTTLGLESQRAVNYWDVNFQLPGGSKIISVKDSLGPITSYVFDGKNIEFKTNTGSSRTKEVVTIHAEFPNAVSLSHSPLKVVNFSLAGFADESTSLTFEVPERLLTTNLPYSYTVEKQYSAVKMHGVGPINLVASYSDSGKEYTNYILFGNADLTDADNLTQIIPRIIGIIPPYTRFPVVVVSDSQYEAEMDAFSAASFRPGGIIYVRQSKVTDPQFASILLHETTHAYNDQILRWMDDGAVWFDEGTATYVGHVTNVLLNVRQAEVFGDEVRFTSGSRIYIYPPRGSAEDLWNYYQSGQTWMREWSPSNSKSQSEREFGYAFSELFIRDYVIRNGDTALHSIYQKLAQLSRSSGGDSATQSILNVMGTELKPCFSQSREELDACLNRVNDATPSVPVVSAVQEKFGTVVDTKSLVNRTLTDIHKERTQLSFSNIIFAIRDFFVSILGLVK